MLWTGGHVMANEWLTPLQSESLTRFFATDTSQDFFLTGGTALAADLQCHVARARRTEHYCEFLLEPGEGQALKVDLVRDVGPQYGEHIKVGNVIVASVENIGANKLAAILGRTEPKDFVDLYFILRAGYDFDDLLEKAKTKDLGLQPFFMAGSWLQVRQFQHLPNTMPPLARPELQAVIISLADRLLDQSRPPENRI
jgi:hypothetical protein